MGRCELSDQQTMQCWKSAVRKVLSNSRFELSVADWAEPVCDKVAHCSKGLLESTRKVWE